MKERERQYNVKRSMIEDRFVNETKDSRIQVLEKQLKDLENDYWDVIEAKSARASKRATATNAKKPQVQHVKKISYDSDNSGVPKI